MPAKKETYCQEISCSSRKSSFINEQENKPTCRGREGEEGVGVGLRAKKNLKEKGNGNKTSSVRQREVGGVEKQQQRNESGRTRQREQWERKLVICKESYNYRKLRPPPPPASTKCSLPN